MVSLASADEGLGALHVLGDASDTGVDGFLDLPKCDDTDHRDKITYSDPKNRYDSPKTRTKTGYERHTLTSNCRVQKHRKHSTIRQHEIYGKSSQRKHEDRNGNHCMGGDDAASNTTNELTSPSEESRSSPSPEQFHFTTTQFTPCLSQAVDDLEDKLISGADPFINCFTETELHENISLHRTSCQNVDIMPVAQKKHAQYGFVRFSSKGCNDHSLSDSSMDVDVANEHSLTAFARGNNSIFCAALLEEARSDSETVGCVGHSRFANTETRRAYTCSPALSMTSAVSAMDTISIPNSPTLDAVATSVRTENFQETVLLPILRESDRNYSMLSSPVCRTTTHPTCNSGISSVPSSTLLQSPHLSALLVKQQSPKLGRNDKTIMKTKVRATSNAVKNSTVGAARFETNRCYRLRDEVDNDAHAPLSSGHKVVAKLAASITKSPRNNNAARILGPNQLVSPVVVDSSLNEAQAKNSLESSKHVAPPSGGRQIKAEPEVALKGMLQPATSLSPDKTLGCMSKRAKVLPAITNGCLPVKPKAMRLVPVKPQQKHATDCPTFAPAASCKKKSKTLVTVATDFGESRSADETTTSPVLIAAISNGIELDGNGNLLLTEEERRTLVSEGYCVPTKTPLSKSEERALKKIRRKIKNKISAQESRRKKKEYVDTLESRVENLIVDNDELRHRLTTAEDVNQMLNEQIRQIQMLLRGKVTLTKVKVSQDASSLLSNCGTLQ